MIKLQFFGSRVPADNNPAQPFWRSLGVHARVIGALMMREATSKYGHENLGFFWVMGEPLLLSSGVMLMWSLVEGGSTHMKAIGVVPMALTGYSMITLWRHLIGGATHAIRRTAGLQFHRNVRPLDILIARASLETLALLTAFTIAYIPLCLMGVMRVMTDPLALIGAFFFQGLFSFSFGLLITALSESWEPAEKFIPPLMYITIPFTGIFSMQTWLPVDYRNIMAWSPLVNTAEMIRGAVIDPEIPVYYSTTYVIVVTSILLSAGLFFVNKIEKHVNMI